MTNDEARMTKGSGGRPFEYSHSVSFLICFSRSWRKLNAILSLQARACGPVVSIPAHLERSSEENAWFRVLLPASSDALQKFLFGNRIIGFDVIGSDAGSSAHQLTDDAIRDRVSWNRLCEIDDSFAESRCSFFKIVSALAIRLFAND